MGVPAPGATGGGPALHLPMLVEDLRARGYDVVTFPYGRWAEGESMVTKMWHQGRDLVRYPGLLRRVRPDLVHLNTAFDPKAILRDVPFALATRLYGVPVFLKWHGSEARFLTSRSPFWRGQVDLLLQLVDGVGVLSSEEAAAVRRHRRAPRCEVVRNGLDLCRYEGRAEVRQRLGVGAGVPLLLFIGRLIPAKGLLDVVAALPPVVRTHGAHLVVVGEGPTRGPAEALARQLGIESAVHFTGRVSEDEAAEYYCGCDVLVFPTYHPEGFPMTVFQSMAGGLGIITTRLRAAADYLRDPDNCLFVPPRDSKAVTAALDRLLEDRALLERMRRTNRDGARRFERRQVAGEIGQMYEDLLAARQRQGVQTGTR
jgi:glycosyltransferase involved in cell wall biosynthesis